MDYPILDVAIGQGVLMAVVAVAHVIVSHFAIGGGLIIAVCETRAWRDGDQAMRDLAKRSSLMLILISTVFGAISGVGIWFVAGLISPGAISALLRNYVWAWAVEWVSFFVEIVAALIYYATWERISKRAHVVIAWIYFAAAFTSLVVINGILSFMLTPGDWLETGAFWDGFFNPTYLPSLLLRTGITLLMASSFMLFANLRTPSAERSRLTRHLGLWLIAGALISYVGFRWWEAALPETVRRLFLGVAPQLGSLADTRLFLLSSLAAAAGLGLLFLLATPRFARVGPLLLIAIVSFAFFGGYERLREGVRKPFLIHDFMFSNGVRVEEVARLREEGILSRAAWAGQVKDGEPVGIGRQVFRAQCASCHTTDGYLSLRELLPPDRDMIYSVVYALYDQGETYAGLVPGRPVDKAELAYPFMPPFVGTEAEMEALVDYLAGLVEDDGQVATREESG